MGVILMNKVEFEIKKQLAILNKVKHLVSMENTKSTHVRALAAFFEVNVSTINRIIRKNMEEFQEDGLIRLKKKELKWFKDKNVLPDSLMKVNSLTVIPYRTVFRIAMLLSKSDVAKRVRTYLLDVEEVVTINGKVDVLNKEESLLLNITRADSDAEMEHALNEYTTYINKKIPKIAKHNVFE